MVVMNYIAFILIGIGAINWGLVGFFNFNLVTAICKKETSIWSTIIYTLVFLSLIWLIFSLIYNAGILSFV